MAQPDLSALISAEVRAAYRRGDEREAATLLRRARAAHPAGSAEYAVLERLEGLLLIAMQREVEGTFALERADAVLDGCGLGYPGLEWLSARGS